MKKKTLQFFAAFLSLVMLSTSSSLSTLALGKDSITESQISNQYQAELHQMGFTDSDILQLTAINNQLAKAKNSREVSRLMEQYHSIVDETLYASAAGSIYSKKGGTLTLNYTGSLSPVSNVIYTKVVYMPSEQVEFYQRAMNSPGFIDWATGEFIGVITAKGAEKIAAYLGIEASSTIWLIGLPISATFYILQNLEQWDLNDAIDRSTTGKVKLEFFYLTSSSAPYYQEYENFEPWNSDFVDIPADYTYSYAGSQLIKFVLPHCKGFGFFLTQILKQQVYRILISFIIFRNLHGIQHFQQCCEVLFLNRGFIVKVSDQRNEQKPLRFVPEWVAALTLTLGVGHQCGDELQNVLFTVDVRHGVIAHTLGKVDGVENL